MGSNEVTDFPSYAYFKLKLHFLHCTTITASKNSYKTKAVFLLYVDVWPIRVSLCPYRGTPIMETDDKKRWLICVHKDIWEDYSIARRSPTLSTSLSTVGVSCCPKTGETTAELLLKTYSGVFVCIPFLWRLKAPLHAWAACMIWDEQASMVLCRSWKQRLVQYIAGQHSKKFSLVDTNSILFHIAIPSRLLTLCPMQPTDLATIGYS